MFICDRAEMWDWLEKQESLWSLTPHLTLDTMKQSKRYTRSKDLITHPTEYSLAIARIFGGFPSSFFTEYHNYFPKTEPVDEYDLRGDLYELFHYLNHTVLFGVSRQDHPSAPRSDYS